MSSGTIVFVAGVSSGFLVLGIVPLGWLADHFRRPPIIGIATAVFGVMVFFTGLASNIFTFFLADSAQVCPRRRPRPFTRLFWRTPTRSAFEDGSSRRWGWQLASLGLSARFWSAQSRRPSG